MQCKTVLTSSKHFQRSTYTLPSSHFSPHTFHTLLHMHDRQSQKHVPRLLTNLHVLVQRSLRCACEAYTANTYTLIIIGTVLVCLLESANFVLLYCICIVSGQDIKEVNHLASFLGHVRLVSRSRFILQFIGRSNLPAGCERSLFPAPV